MRARFVGVASIAMFLVAAAVMVAIDWLTEWDELTE